MRYCHKCASAHKPEWHSVGCAAAGCEESLEQLCRDAATDDLTGEVQMKFHGRARQAAEAASAALLRPGRGATRGWAAAAGAAALAALVAAGALRVRARGRRRLGADAAEGRGVSAGSERDSNRSRRSWLRAKGPGASQSGKEHAATNRCASAWPPKLWFL
ncbi:unnamed protein product [Prorocentrum cordatum]|uniref:Uncharacterized protein n=1 Tax=Prorocentrum cordatum TaxID=2364126 RepID=A0ABN9S0E3_9DINO|nr:unnamed protein product [Polarella glacialis]